jgi:hypothetical protein
VRIILRKADESGKVSVSEVRERLDELMGDRPYKVLHEAEGQLLVTSGSVELSFTDIEGKGVGVFVVWDLGEDEDSTYEICKDWQELKEFVEWAIGIVEWGTPIVKR